MNRNTRLKPLAPRPVHDMAAQHMTPYAGHAGAVVNNGNAFAGANLGVHASPLEAVTSMDPRDYVWGGYDASFHYQQPVCGGESHYQGQGQYQACGFNGQHYGFTQTCQPAPGTDGRCSYESGSFKTGVEDSNEDMKRRVGRTSIDTQASESKALDSKVDDLLDLDDDALRKLLKPSEAGEVDDMTEERKTMSARRRTTRLASMHSAHSNASDADELIMPDFGEGFHKSDTMLLSIPLGSGTLDECGDRCDVDDCNPYLDPLSGPSMASGGNRSSSQNCYAAETQGSSPNALPSSPANSPKSPTSHVPPKAAADAASGNPLLAMSMSEAVKCILHFLRTDARVSEEKRQAAIAAVQEVVQRGPVVTLRHSAVVKPHPKRKRSSLKNR